MHNEEKENIIIKSLEKGLTMIHLNACPDEVIVPHTYKRLEHLRLNLSYKFPMADLDVNTERVKATLTFSGESFSCMIPLDYIFGVTSFADHQLYLFPDSIPAGALEEWENIMEEEMVNSMSGSKRPLALQLIKGGKTLTKSEDSDSDSDDINSVDKKAPFLQVIDGGACDE